MSKKVSIKKQIIPASEVTLPRDGYRGRRGGPPYYGRYVDDDRGGNYSIAIVIAHMVMIKGI